MVAEAESKEKVEAVLKACAADLEAAAPLTDKHQWQCPTMFLTTLTTRGARNMAGQTQCATVESWQALFEDMDWKTTTLGGIGVHLKVLLCKVPSML